MINKTIINFQSFLLHQMVYLTALKRLALEWIMYTAGMHFINGHLECIRCLPFSPRELLHEQDALSN